MAGPPKLQHRIRCGALIVDGDRLLLVKHRHPKTGFVWWAPPGGRVEGEESIFDCATTTWSCFSIARSSRER
ncbi:MAG: NUDIX hydrolase [Chloroflexi bacterium]|nr:NUDIX hydrolase [Chloroflexota bacterium]